MAKCHHSNTPTNLGYCDMADWAERKSRRHYQEQCPVCGKWAIWKRIPRGKPNYWVPDNVKGVEDDNK